MLIGDEVADKMPFVECSVSFRRAVSAVAEIVVPGG